jgi:hypothetical protein
MRMGISRMDVVRSDCIGTGIRSLLVVLLSALVGGNLGYVWAQLSATDRPAWASAIGSIVSGLGAMGAAVTALHISDRDRRTTMLERHEQGHLSAWYLTTHLQRIAEFSLRVHGALLAVDLGRADVG